MMRAEFDDTFIKFMSKLDFGIWALWVYWDTTGIHRTLAKILAEEYAKFRKDDMIDVRGIYSFAANRHESKTWSEGYEENNKKSMDVILKRQRTSSHGHEPYVTRKRQHVAENNGNDTKKKLEELFSSQASRINNNKYAKS